MGPRHERPRRINAEPVRLGHDAHSSEVETVGVPAGLQRGVARGEPIGVQPARLEEQLEPRIVQVHQAAAKGSYLFDFQSRRGLHLT